jgi:hypothetical protein
VAKAESPPKAESLDEQISSLLESVEVNGKETEAHEHLVHEPPAPAPRRRSLRRSRDDSKSTPASPPARKQAKKAPARRKARSAAKQAPPRRKAPPARKVAKTRQRPQARAHAKAAPRSRPRAPRQFFADPATRELAFFVIAGLMIGALVGVLFALAG